MNFTKTVKLSAKFLSFLLKEREIAKKIDAIYTLAYYVLAHAYSQKGLYEKAAQNMEMFERLGPKSRV